MVDSHEAVNMGDLKKFSAALYVVGSNFNKEAFPG